MKLFYTTFITLIILSASGNLRAQPSVSFYFTTAFPVNDYQYIDDNVGYGGNLEFFFLSPSQKSPIGIGISFSYLGQGLYFYDDPCNCDTYIGNNRANNFINSNLILQVAPTGGVIRPYLETFFGGSYIYSSTEIVTLYYNTVDLYIDDWAWTYGVGGGLKFLLGANKNGKGAFFLDLKGRYMMSSDVDVLDRNSIRYANDRFYYTVNETQINFFSLQMGIQFYFR